MNVLKSVLNLLTDKPTPFSELEEKLNHPNLNTLRRTMIQLENTDRAALIPGQGWYRK